MNGYLRKPVSPSALRKPSRIAAVDDCAMIVHRRVRGAFDDAHRSLMMRFSSKSFGV